MAFGGYDPDLEELLLALSQGAHGEHSGRSDLTAPLAPMQPNFNAQPPPAQPGPRQLAPMQPGPRPLPFGPPQGRQVGGLFVASNPLESLAYGAAGIKQQGDAQRQQQAMAQRRQQFLAGIKDPAARQAAEAMFSGDPAMAAYGGYVLKKAMESQAKKTGERPAPASWGALPDMTAEEAIQSGYAKRPETDADLKRGKLAAEIRALGGDQWSAIADPVTGGIVLYNKKTREAVPLGPGGGQPAVAPPGPLPGIPGKPTENQRTKVLGASESISQLDMAIEALKKAPGAYGGVGNFVAGLAEAAGGTPAQSIMSRRYNPEELKVKNYVSNVVSKIINERAGANVTLREELRQKFLPQDTDSLDNAQQKLVDLRRMMSTTYKAQGGPADPEQGNPDASVRRFTRGPDGKLVEVK